MEESPLKKGNRILKNLQSQSQAPTSSYDPVMNRTKSTGMLI